MIGGSTFTGGTITAPLLAPDGTPGGNMAYGFSGAPTTGLGRNGTDLQVQSAAGIILYAIGTPIYFFINGNGYITFVDGATPLIQPEATNIDIGSTAKPFQDIHSSRTAYLEETANGAAIKCGPPLTELTTINAAASTDTAIQIPANFRVDGVAVRVIVKPPGTANFTVTGATTSTVFQVGANVSSDATTTDVGMKSTPYLNTAAQAIRITPDASPSDNTGRIRVVILGCTIVPPGS